MNLCSAAAVMISVEVLIGLVIGYPAMLWAVGGGWWGLAGMALHLTLLLKVRLRFRDIKHNKAFH